MTDHIALDTAEILEFCDGTEDNYAKLADPPASYYMARSEDWRPNGHQSKLFINYTRIHNFEIVKTDGDFIKVLGKVSANVICRTPVSLSLRYALFIKKGISSERVERIRKLFHEYLPNPLIEFDQGIASYIPADISSTDFYIDKYPDLMRDGATESNSIQLESLLSLYDHANDRSQVDIGQPFDGYKYSDWASENRIFLQPTSIDLSVVASEISGNTTHQIQENSNINSEDLINDAATEIVNDLLAGPFPLECGEMIGRKDRFARLPSLPETKLSRVDVEVNLGCHQIIVTLYIPSFRTCELNAYYYYLIPKQTVTAGMQAVYVCAQRAVIYGTVLGFVFANPAVAAAAFNAELRICAKEYIKKCYDGGIFVVTVVGDWQLIWP